MHIRRMLWAIVAAAVVASFAAGLFVGRLSQPGGGSMPQVQVDCPSSVQALDSIHFQNVGALPANSEQVGGGFCAETYVIPELLKGAPGTVKVGPGCAGCYAAVLYQVEWPGRTGEAILITPDSTWVTSNVTNVGAKITPEYVILLYPEQLVDSHAARSDPHAIQRLFSADVVAATAPVAGLPVFQDIVQEVESIHK